MAEIPDLSFIPENGEGYIVPAVNINFCQNWVANLESAHTAFFIKHGTLLPKHRGRREGGSSSLKSSNGGGVKILKLYSSHNRRREDVQRLRHKLRKDGVSWSEEVEGRFVLDNVIVETKTVGDKRLREGRWDAVIYQEDVVVEGIVW